MHEVDEFLEVISTQTDRLIRLADDLVTIDQPRRRQLAIEPEPIVLVPALEALVARSARAATGSRSASPKVRPRT